MYYKVHDQNNKKSSVRRHLKWKPFSNSLILKQILKSTWKSKLQLVTLLLLSVFCTIVISGSWIAYSRLQNGIDFMGINNNRFDAALNYSAVPTINTSIQIADQAFSLNLGHLNAKKTDGSNQINNALYFDNTRIGKDQEINKITKKDVKFTYEKDGTQIIGIKDFIWNDPEQPLKFNEQNENVKGSIYGQLKQKANMTNNFALKQKYLDAANKLYNEIFKKTILSDIHESIRDFVNAWIPIHSSELENTNDDVATGILLANINYNEKSETSNNDYTISGSTNVFNHPEIWNKIVQVTDPDPRASEDSIGMNGQWVRVLRKFASSASDQQKADFNHSYVFKYFNTIKDNYDNQDQLYSYQLMSAVSALQNRDIRVVNQFATTVDSPSVKSTINAKVIKLGFKSNYNDVDLKIIEGLAPTSKDQVVISPQYARVHKILPGDKININKREFRVTGIGGDALNIYPRIGLLDVIPNANNEYIVYVLPNAYNDKSWIDWRERSDSSTAYFLPWKNSTVKDFNTSEFDDYFQRNIFANNGKKEDYQSEYIQYLKDKYVFHKTTQLNNFKLSLNGVVDSSNPQFNEIYNFGINFLFSIRKSFLYTVIFGVLFLTIIVIFITFLIIKKAIQNSQISMGILKATGYKTAQIAWSYIAYGLIVLLIAIPVGWLIGIGSQYYFTGIFNSLFILPYNVFSFSFWPLLISALLIVGFICVTAICTAYIKLQKNALNLIKQNTDISIGNIHYGFLQRIFEKNFKTKFLLSLTKTSWKKIAVTASVIGLATLAISTSISIPASINKMNSDYFKTQKYQNYYKYQTPTPNMPLSKIGISSWNNLNNINNEPYYPVAGVMPFPSHLIIKDEQGNKLAFLNPLDYKKVGDNNDNLGDIVKFISKDVDKEQIIRALKQNFNSSSSYGPLSSELLTWNFTWLSGRAFSNSMITDLQAQDNSPDRSFSQNLIGLAGDLLPSLLEITNPGFKGPDAISKILQTILPGYVRKILDNLKKEKEEAGDKNFDPYKEFGIGHNTISINPNFDDSIAGPQEELATQISLISNSSKISGNFNVLGINPQTKMLKINNNLVEKMQYIGDQKYIPLVINRTFAAKHNLQIGSQFNAYPQINTLYYRNDKGKYVPFPKANWYYGNDPVHRKSSDKNIWSTTANKWNYRGDQNLSDGYKTAFGYNYDGEYDKSGNRKLYNNPPQEWNNINKIWLKLPSDIDPAAKIGTIPGDREGKGTGFHIGNISLQNNPDWIQPFSNKVSEDYKNQNLDPVTILGKRVPEWFGGMLSNKILLKQNNIESTTINDDIINKMPDWWENVTGDKNQVHSYKVIGFQDSYDSPRAFIDQHWANRVSGYTLINKEDATKSEDPMTQSGLYQWFNAKFSTADNIYDLIARQSVRYHSDDYTLYAAGLYEENRSENIVDSPELLSKIRLMISKMTDLAFRISALFIIVAIVCSILIVIMITDAFTEQFRRFMGQMKSEGYTNYEINSFTLGIFIPWVFIGYILGYGAGYLLFFALLKAISISTSLVFPFSFIWWIIPLSFFLIASIFASTFIINNSQINKMNLIELLKSEE